MRRLASVLLLVVAIVLGACGAGETDAVDVGAAPTAPERTDTTAPPPSGGEAVQVTVYFVKDGRLVPATRTVSGGEPAKGPATTSAGQPPGEDDAALHPAAARAVEALLRGPTPAERSGGFTTAIPEQTRFLGLDIDDRIATVDLSREFQAGGDTASLEARLAQVACTLDNVVDLDIVDGTRFLIDGERVKVFSGAGIVLDDPVTCAHYAELLR